MITIYRVVAYVRKKAQMRKSPVLQHHFHWTGKFWGIAHNKCILTTQKKFAWVVLSISHAIYSYDRHLIFENLLKIANERFIERKAEDAIAKSSENYKTVKRMLEVWRFFIGFRKLVEIKIPCNKYLSLLRCKWDNWRLFHKDISFPYKKLKFRETIYRLSNLKWKELYSAVKKSAPKKEQKQQRPSFKKRTFIAKIFDNLILGNHVLPLTDVFPNFAETSEQGNNPLQFYSARSVIWRAGVKLTGNDKDTKLGVKLGMEHGNFIRCSTAFVGGKRYVK